MMIRRGTSHRFLTVCLAFSFTALLVFTNCNTSSREEVLERNKSLVLTMNDELWNKGKLDKMDEFFSTDIVRHFLPDGSEVRGIDSLQKQEMALRKAFPDWGEDIRHIVAEGNFVVIHFVSTGTNMGRWLGKPPTRNNIRINEMSIFRIKDGKIAEQWLLPDIYSMQQQLMATTLDGGTEK